MKKLNISINWCSTDFGQSRRGVDMGPSAIRYAGAVGRIEAIGHQVTDEGDIQVSAVERKEHSDSNLKNLDEVIQANYGTCRKVAKLLKQADFRLF